MCLAKPTNTYLFGYQDIVLRCKEISVKIEAGQYLIKGDWQFGIKNRNLSTQTAEVSCSGKPWGNVDFKVDSSSLVDTVKPLL